MDGRDRKRQGNKGTSKIAAPRDGSVWSGLVAAPTSLQSGYFTESDVAGMQYAAFAFVDTQGGVGC